MTLHGNNIQLEYPDFGQAHTESMFDDAKPYT